MFFALPLALSALAGQAAGLTLMTGLPGVGNISAVDMFNFQDKSLTACESSCSLATSTLKACQDDTCICSNTTATEIMGCEQCMFTNKIAINDPAPNPMAGSTPIIGIYAAACNQSVQHFPNTTTLVLPANWNGPVTEILNTPATIIAVGSGAILGIGALLIMSNI